MAFYVEPGTAAVREQARELRRRWYREGHPQRRMGIDELIVELQQAKARGAEEVSLTGIATLLIHRDNQVLLTTEPQI